MSNEITGVAMHGMEPKIDAATNVAPSNATTGNDAKPASADAVKPAQQPKVIDDRELDQAIQRLNELAASQKRDLHFSKDDMSGRTVVRVVNSQTQETVRQIPSEEVLEIARRFSANETGQLLSTLI